MIPHAGCIPFFGSPCPSFASQNEKSTKRGRGRGDEISSYEIVFLSPNTVLRDRTRCLSASRISIERPFPVRFHVAKKITRRGDGSASWADLVRERKPTRLWNKIAPRFRFSREKVGDDRSRALIFVHSRFNTCTLLTSVKSPRGKVSIISSTRSIKIRNVICIINLSKLVRPEFPSIFN